MENGVVVNGNGITSRPRTPSINTLSLTEYSMNPSPPSTTPRSKTKGVVPDEFILPNGYPDVCISPLSAHFQLIPANSTSASSSPPAFTKLSKKHPSLTRRTSAIASNAKSSSNEKISNRSSASSYEARTTRWLIWIRS